MKRKRSTTNLRLRVKKQAPSSMRDQIIKVIQKDPSVPVFSSTALKLLDLSSKADLDLDSAADVVKLDPGLTTKYLRLANSVVFGGKSIDSIRDALLRIGMNEIRKLASSIGVMEVMILFRGKSKKKPAVPDVEWEMFWLHSLLTARLTDSIAGVYRATSGREYLAGLLHDAGKLFMGRFFPTEFKAVMDRAVKSGQNLYEVENDVFKIHHAEVSALLCEKWQLNAEIIQAVRHHHHPTPPKDSDSQDMENGKFLATCICIADLLANMCKANIPGTPDLETIDCEALPQWKLLERYPSLHHCDIDVFGELQKAQEAINILGAH